MVVLSFAIVYFDKAKSDLSKKDLFSLSAVVQFPVPTISALSGLSGMTAMGSERSFVPIQREPICLVTPDVRSEPKVPPNCTSQL